MANLTLTSSRLFISASVAATCCAGATSATATSHAPHKRAAATERPNVILIVADDLGYGDLACYGARNVQTPNSDRLAREGVRFTNTHAIAATSTPSRYSILTGQYAWRKPGTDVAPGNAGMIIRPEQYTMADMFHNAGYATAAIGKWHLGIGDKTGEQDWNRPLPMHLKDIGFDYHYIMAATADRVPCVYIENGAVANYDPTAPIEVSYKKNFPGVPTGQSNPELMYNLKPSHGHDMAIVNGIGRIGYMKGGGKALWKDENIADSITLHAVDFIKRNAAEGDKPFFMYFCTNDVHVPRFPHDRFRGKNPMGLRGDAIAQFDWSIGQILDTLDSLGIADNTLIILTSDNGPILDDGYADQAAELLNGHRPTGPFRGNKYSAFEGGTMVPMIVRWPGKVKGGMQSNALFSQIDYVASLGQLINASHPDGGAPDSRPYLTTLLGRKKNGCPWVVEFSSNHTMSIRTPHWKYITPKDGPAKIQWGPDVETGNLPEPQLYDMRSDLGETRNLAPANPKTVNRLDSLLKQIMQ